MAVNKVVYDGNTLVDLTSDTVTPDALVVGHTAHGANGEKVSGSNPYEKAATDTEVQTQADLIAQIGAALEGKGGSGTGIVPTGTKQIKTNGTHDVTAYAYAEVAVPSEMPETVEQATPVISVSSSGKITATATQTEGFVEGGTKTATKQLTTKGSTIITPTTSVQTAVSAGTYVTGDIKVAAVSGGGGTEDDLYSVAFISNHYSSAGEDGHESGADLASVVVFFKPGWTWADYIASQFNYMASGAFGVPDTPTGGAVPALTSDPYVRSTGNDYRYLGDDFFNWNISEDTEQIVANKIYYWM